MPLARNYVEHIAIRIGQSRHEGDTWNAEYRLSLCNCLYLIQTLFLKQQVDVQHNYILPISSGIAPLIKRPAGRHPHKVAP